MWQKLTKRANKTTEKQLKWMNKKLVSGDERYLKAKAAAEHKRELANMSKLQRQVRFFKHKEWF